MNRKYAIHGIIGCVLFGIGDWLLGYVDPGEVTGDVFYFINAITAGWISIGNIWMFAGLLIMKNKAMKLRRG